MQGTIGNQTRRVPPNRDVSQRQRQPHYQGLDANLFYEDRIDITCSDVNLRNASLISSSSHTTNIPPHKRQKLEVPGNHNKASAAQAIKTPLPPTNHTPRDPPPTTRHLLLGTQTPSNYNPRPPTPSCPTRAPASLPSELPNASSQGFGARLLGRLNGHVAECVREQAWGALECLCGAGKGWVGRLGREEWRAERT